MTQSILNSQTVQKIDNDYYDNIVLPELQKILPNHNKYALPYLVSIKVTTGFNKNSNYNKGQNLLCQISGQYASFTKAKKSINAFRLGKGNIVGAQVTLRKRNMFNFLHSLIYVVLPSVNNFRGFSIKSLQGHKHIYTLSFGIKDVALFPCADIDSSTNMGCNINIAVRANNKQEAHLLLAEMLIPFKESCELREINNG